MKHVVLVPAWRRDDMLHACLTRLAKASSGHDVTIIVSLDRGHDPACQGVAESFRSSFRWLYLRKMHHHQFHGNSYNLLSGLKDALPLGGDLLHVVEDDVLVSLGYFPFHEGAREAFPEAFSVSACRNQNLHGGAEGPLYTHGSYQSLGVSFRPEVAVQATAHDLPVYYGGMTDYCKRVWPHSAIPAGHAEQDGVFNRIREAQGGVSVFSSRPRAFHAGFHGYNRPGSKLSGGLLERSARILAMDSAEMNAMAGLVKDHEVIDLDENLPAEKG